MLSGKNFEVAPPGFYGPPLTGNPGYATAAQALLKGYFINLSVCMQIAPLLVLERGYYVSRMLNENSQQFILDSCLLPGLSRLTIPMRA
jgi:hypothetical protein